MTTAVAAKQYLQEHLKSLEDKGYHVYNPENKPLEGLPAIYGFNNGGGDDWYSAVAIAEDGTVLGGHICSSEAYMPYDLGMLQDTRQDRHEESYQPHYPKGYRMEFVSSKEIKGHIGLNKAFENNKNQPKEG